LDSLTAEERTALYNKEKAASDARRLAYENDLQDELDTLTEDQHDAVWSVADSLWAPEYPGTTEGFRGRMGRIYRALETVRAAADPKLLIVPASAGLTARQGVRTVTSYSEEVKPPAKLKTEAGDGAGGEGGGAC
jgi:hypothetical protein